jgi:hypothetical protein
VRHSAVADRGFDPVSTFEDRSQARRNLGHLWFRETRGAVREPIGLGDRVLQLGALSKSNVRAGSSVASRADLLQRPLREIRLSRR